MYVFQNHAAPQPLTKPALDVSIGGPLHHPQWAGFPALTSLRDEFEAVKAKLLDFDRSIRSARASGTPYDGLKALADETRREIAGLLNEIEERRLTGVSRA